MQDINQAIPGLMRLRPHLVEKIWGGPFLSSRSSRSERIGESWEVADLADGKCTYGEIPINSYIGDRGRQFWGGGGKCPYIVKYIDAAENLSIQVHPDDEYVSRNIGGGERGKSECWIILDCFPSNIGDPTLMTPGVYLGLRPGVGPADLGAALEKNSWIAELLNFYPVSPGECWMVPAGAIHAISSGVLLLEVQQASGITYRAWDWNRTDKNGRQRDLHLEQALQCINFDPHFNFQLGIAAEKNVWGRINSKIELVEHPDFGVSSVLLDNEEVVRFATSSSGGGVSEHGRAATIIVLEGKCEITRGEEMIESVPYQTILVPSMGEKIIQIVAKGRSKIIIIE